MALKGFDRTPKAETRTRRNAGRLNNFDTVLGDGLAEEAGLIVLSLATDPGLEFSSGALRAKVAAPITRGASGIGLAFGTGLQNDSGTLKSKDSEIDHDALLNFVANEHIDWTGASSNFQTSGTATLTSGDLIFSGSARIGWTKKAAASITRTAGTSANGVADLQTLGDGNFYALTEAAATPGMDLAVNFTSISAFNFVQVLAQYDGSTTHSVAVQLYNWNTTAWDTFDALQSGQEEVSTAGGYILGNHSFFVPDDTNYIGTGGDAGKVSVRFYHTMAGNASHDLYVDVVALYQ